MERAGPVQKQAGPVESGKLINVKQAVGTYTDWVLPCQAGRQRCTNLALASQGFQCMTLDNRACCLNGNGKNCWRLSRAGDDSTPDNWTGRELAGGWSGGCAAVLAACLQPCHAYPSVVLEDWLVGCVPAACSWVQHCPARPSPAPPPSQSCMLTQPPLSAALPSPLPQMAATTARCCACKRAPRHSSQ